MSTQAHIDKDESASSIEEAARRREELDRGTVRPMSADEFWSGIEREWPGHRRAIQ